MAKEKKITIKHFLNKRLRPKITDKSGKRFPVYTNVTYNRQTTALNLLPQFNEEGLTEAEFQIFLKSIQNPVLGAAIHRIEKAITLSIRYEENNLKEGFVMNGFSKRLEVYFENVTSLYNKLVSQLLAKEIESWITVEAYRQLFNIKPYNYDFSPKDNNFNLTYFKIKQRYIPDIQQRLYNSPYAASYSGYAQWLNFENMKGQFVDNPYRNNHVFSPKRFTLIECIGGENHEDYIQFLNCQVYTKPYEYRAVFPIPTHEEYERGIIYEFPTQKQHLNSYIKQIKAFVPVYGNGVTL